MMTTPRARFRAWAVLVIILVGAVAAAIPASADPVPRPPAAPKAPTTADQIFARLSDADQAVIDATIRLRDADQSSAVAARAAHRSRVEVAAAAAKVRVAAQDLTRQTALWHQLTIHAYVGGSVVDATQLEQLLRGKISDQTGQAGVMFGQVVIRHLDRLRGARATYARALAVMRAAAAHAPSTQDAASERARARTAAQRRLSKVLTYRDRVRTTLRRAAFIRQPQVSLATPLLGLPRLSSADLAGWFKATQHHALTRMPVEFLAAWFIDEGRREGVRGDVAFAQAVLETGGFTNIDSVWVNNYAGIGHCDTCPRGFAFKTPQLGVRAQIQLLKSYAVKKARHADPLVDPRLHGPAGCCPTWGDLTRKWATAPTYGPRIMAIYTDLMEFALRRHAALLPPG